MSAMNIHDFTNAELYALIQKHHEETVEYRKEDTARQDEVRRRLDIVEARVLVNPADVLEIREAVAWQLNIHRWVRAHKFRARFLAVLLFVAPQVLNVLLRRLGWL